MASKQVLSREEASEIAVDAYVFGYPLVLMDLTRRAMTNVEAPIASPSVGQGAPINQFVHLGEFPDSRFTEVVRPNADTLYSILWFDVSKEPLVIDVPDSGGRYYLLEMLDMWTDVFSSPGKRTRGTGSYAIAIVAPDWRGTLPDDIELNRAPTAQGWIIGRTQTDGKQDYDNVHKFQAGLKATPLSARGTRYTPPRGTVDPSIPKLAPVEQLARMDAATFFARLCEVATINPPHLNDYPILERMQRIGIVLGQKFDLAKVPPDARQAFDGVVETAFAKINAYQKHADRVVNNWSMTGSPIGTYGSDYLKRAMVAYMGLGANTPDDAVYPAALGIDGQPFDSGQHYILRFPKDQLPPVRAFWSLTMYNDKQLFADNAIDRYAIGDRDNLKFEDGHLNLYIQRESPGPDKESNWLPTPSEGSFTMNLRLYWPKPEVTDGTWAPPPVQKAA